VTGGNATVTDAGLIRGGTYSVEFTGGGTDRLILDPGAVLVGKVSGAGANSTLELAAGTASVSGLGTTFAGFKAINVDAKGQWTDTGTNKIATNTALNVNGTLTVSGSLNDAGAVTVRGRLQTSGAGTIDVAKTMTLHAGSVLVANATGAIEIGGTGSAAKGLVTVDSGATLNGAGTVNNTVHDNGTMLAAGGTLAITGSITGVGGVSISSHAVLSVGGALGAQQLKFLAGGHETAAFGAPTKVTSTIAGFAATDKLDLVNFKTASLSFANHTLNVDGVGGTVAHLYFNSTYIGHHFAFTADGHGGTNISLV
jgi:hypothetical protein